jgi:ferredoxin
VTTYRSSLYDAELCLGCGTCARVCPTQAAEARPVPVEEIRERVNVPVHQGPAPASGAGASA